jgi:hypothetical protein
MLLPVWVWTVAAALALVGAGVVLRALFSDRSRGRVCCPRCWYDMAGTPGLTCPECGRAARSERDLHRTRRRWGLAAAGGVLLLPVLGVAGARYGRTAWYWLPPRWRVVEQHRVKDAVVTLYEPRDPKSFGMRALVVARGRTIADLRDFRLMLGVRNWQRPGAVGVFEDLTGDKVPEVVIEGWSGGAHCCSTVHIVRLGKEPKVIATIDAKDHGVRFEPTGTPGVADIILGDSTFAYWHAPYAASPSPEVWLHFRGGEFAVDPQRQARPLPPREELESLSMASRARCFSGSEPEPALWGAALNLLYSGHEAEAWALLDSPWPPHSPEHDKFIAAFREQLSTSPWWPKVKAALAATAAGSTTP